MAMTHAEIEFMKQGSDQTKGARVSAIAAAGPLFNMARQTTLEYMLGHECKLTKTDVSALMAKFAEAGSNDENDVAEIKRTVMTALDPLVSNKQFLPLKVEEIAKQVEAARDERDKKIVAAGGPERPGPGWTMA